MLRQLFGQLQTSGIQIAIAGPIGPILDILKRSEIVAMIGDSSFFDTAHNAYLWLKGKEDEISTLSRTIALESRTNEL